MQPISELLKQSQAKALNFDPIQWQVDRMNAVVGNEPGPDCQICKNRRYIAYAKDGEIMQKPCACLKAARSLLRAQRSGLGQLLEKCTFSSYTASEPWQTTIKEEAESFAANPHGWFSINGSSGAGKTHLCTAIVSALIASGKEARYFVWPDEIRKVKANINDDYAEDSISKAKSIEVLYIDDFLKTGDTFNSEKQAFFSVPPTASDIRLAFEIVNYRSNNNLITIFSSERTLEEINKFDYALGSRICQMCGDNSIKLIGDKNYRMR